MSFDEEMIKKYPLLFDKQTLFPVDCKEGWHHLLDSLFYMIDGRIRIFNKNATDDEKKVFVVDQIKEKYGTLRIYYRGGDDYIDGLVAMTEAISKTTCETCGNVGKLRGDKWLYTACDKHTED